MQVNIIMFLWCCFVNLNIRVLEYVTLPTDMLLVPGAACTSVLLLFPSSLSMSEAVVDIGVADLEPVKSDSSSCNEQWFIYNNKAMP